ncbi:hypothetical protein M569_06685 [Genlisea aurea]|uniref:CCHC-type domain-containing protein n=1 Tax=Genlisea aurea TaxID=192259 RepID=S8DXT7_9LAMI|nr:hypothetical protein M569_06685 [Genlisea aurea]
MSETEGIKDYVDRMSTLVNQMRLLGDNVTDQRIVEKISVTVSSHFDSTITSLEAVTNFSALSVSDLISALESMEVRRAIRDEIKPVVLSEKAFQAGTNHSKGRGDNKQKMNGKFSSGFKKGIFPPCPHCSMTNHSESFCFQKHTVQCSTCNQFGHVDRICPTKFNKGMTAGSDQKVVEDSTDGIALASFVGNSVSEQIYMHSWLVDSVVLIICALTSLFL